MSRKPWSCEGRVWLDMAEPGHFVVLEEIDRVSMPLEGLVRRMAELTLGEDPREAHEFLEGWRAQFLRYADIVSGFRLLVGDDTVGEDTDAQRAAEDALRRSKHERVREWAPAVDYLMSGQQ